VLENWLINFGASRDLCKIMVYIKKDDDKAVKGYATEILNNNGDKNLVWLLQEPSAWGNHTGYIVIFLIWILMN